LPSFSAFFSFLKDYTPTKPNKPIEIMITAIVTVSVLVIVLVALFVVPRVFPDKATKAAAKREAAAKQKSASA